MLQVVVTTGRGAAHLGEGVRPDRAEGGARRSQAKDTHPTRRENKDHGLTLMVHSLYRLTC